MLTGMVSAISGGVSAGLAGHFNVDPISATNNSVGAYMANAGTNMAGAIANAATRSLIQGTNFGDNILAGLPDVIGQTIGGMVADGVASIGATNRAASASVDRLRQAVLGDGPISEEQASQLATVRNAVKYAARHSSDADARAGADAAVRDFLDANRGNVGVDDFMSSTGHAAQPISAPGDVTVTGSRGYWSGRTIDRAGIWVGENARDIQNAAGEFVSEHPGLGVALSVANIGLTIAGGPVRFVGGLLLDSVKDRAAGWISGQMEGPNLWSTEKAQAGGQGFVLAGGILLSGAAALKVGLGRRANAAEEVGAVRPGQTGTYGELKTQKGIFGEIERLDMDHQPSYAAQVAAREAAIGRKLDPAERASLKASTPAVASPRVVHQTTSPTYGGRNTPAQIASDAADLAAAQARDRAAFDQAMRRR